MITLTPTATELVAAVGAGATLVGVDDFSTYPPEVADLPRVGSFLSPNLEAILRLRPQLVIADDVHADLEASLRDAGIATLQCDMHGLDDVRRGLVAVGERLDRADAARAAVVRIDAAVDAAATRRHGAPPRVLLVIDREVGGLGNMVAAGTGSWLDDLVALLGASNVLSASGVRYPKISPEEILRAAPDVIIDASYVADPARVAADWADVASVPAVAAGRVVVLHEPYFLAPSPRVDLALERLAAALYP
ncbi:MAG: ABC transporter substrate-binding protein [Kofleriaceae bacterium]|nr:ABC transporter substrate-binding protein [Kofleriaceae bacterium]